nr:hypothetical protein [Gemmatimonadota bacterium]
MWIRGAALALAVVVTACGGTAPPEPTPVPQPERREVVAPRLPPIPRVDGPLRLRVSYPRASGYVATRDS